MMWVLIEHPKQIILKLMGKKIFTISPSKFCLFKYKPVYLHFYKDVFNIEFIKA